ncbi:restriction endonuclease subunit S [Crassaminicella thermophila]|uniref:Restriction endonuclease subunit S n=2 Tax=Crassaminicella thermophila TaxID=2599308 RepID=A0A5C0SGY0_CRATE|nr:restriction endonuclease subunit S [Crassaminicella thermophila]
MEDLKRYELFENDILMSLTGNVGRVGILRKSMLPAALNQRVACLRIKNKAVDFKFLYYYLNSDQFENLCIENSKGIAQKNLSTVFLKNVLIPLPALETQKKIVEVLDKAQELIDLRKKQIELLDELIQSIFYDMFGDPVTNPKGWDVRKLKDISTKIINGTTPKGGKQVYVEDGIVFLRSQNVWKNRLLLDDVAYIDNETHTKMAKSSLKYKDILMTKTGRINTENSSLGRAAMFLGEDDSANINGHVYLIRLQKNIIHEFVLFILTTNEYREYIRSVCVGGIDKRQINKEHLQNFPIILPPIELQNQFAEMLQKIEEQKQLMQQSLIEMENNFNCLVQRAFKGELFNE